MTIRFTIIVPDPKTHAGYAKIISRVRRYAKVQAIEKAPSGKVKDHHERKKGRFLKLLCMKIIRSINMLAIMRSANEKESI